MKSTAEPIDTTEVDAIIDPYASKMDYRRAASKFLDLERWTGDDPVLLIADAAGTTTGQGYFTHVKPEVEAFKRKFIDSGLVSTVGALAQLPIEDEEFRSVFAANRKRTVAVSIAGVLVDTYGDDGLTTLQEWARNANPYEYERDPVGAVSGLGLATFQYLRMISGVDTVKPDVQVAKFIREIAPQLDHRTELSAETQADTLKSCEWLSAHSSYRMIELDQIAWWTFTDTDKGLH